MSKKEEVKTSSISEADNVRDISTFWDEHSLDDFWNKTREVEFNVNIDLKRRVRIDAEVYRQIEAQAHERGVSTETLVNIWLVEKLRAE